MADISLRPAVFGILIAPGSNREFPVVVPTHFHYDGARTILLHLAPANPIWTALQENRRCLCVVIDAVAYVPTSWEAPPGTPPEWGIPTSHYAAINAHCTATITDDPSEIRNYLAEQLSQQCSPTSRMAIHATLPHHTNLSSDRSEGYGSQSTTSARSSSSTAQSPTPSA